MNNYFHTLGERRVENFQALKVGSGPWLQVAWAWECWLNPRSVDPCGLKGYKVPSVLGRKYHLLACKLHAVGNAIWLRLLRAYEESLPYIESINIFHSLREQSGVPADKPCT